MRSDKGIPSLKALVIDYSSIGQRHGRVLIELGCNVAVMGRRSIEFEPSYSELSQALSAWQPDYEVVANGTSEHFQTLSPWLNMAFGVLP